MAARKVRVRLLGELWDRDAKGVRTVHPPNSVISVPADMANKLCADKSAEPYADPAATRVAEVGGESAPQADPAGANGQG